jgi:hypothetical protein
MNNLLIKAQALQDEIEATLSFQASLDKRENDIAIREEAIKTQNITHSKSVEDLVARQELIRKEKSDLSDLEMQISIKEKSILLAQEALNTLKESLITKEKDLTSRGQQIVQKEEDFKAWEEKVRTAEKEAEAKRLLNQQEETLDQIRKSKLKVKEEQVEAELSRLKGMAT